MPGRTFEVAGAYRYGFNGMEKDNEWSGKDNVYFTLHRVIDVRVGRWMSTDPEEEEFPDMSPYTSMDDNPIELNDPDGDCPTCPAGAVGAVVGGLFGGGIELGRQLWNDGKVTSWSAIGGSTVQGAITGGAAGLTGGASLLTTVAVSGTANAVGGTINRTIQGKSTTATDLAIDGTVGGVLGAGGKYAGKIVEKTTNSLSRGAKGNLGETVTQLKYGAKGYASQGKAIVATGGRTATGKIAVAEYDHAMKNVVTGKRLTVESKFNKSGFTPNQKAAQNRVTTPGGLIVDRTTSHGLGNTTRAATGGIGGGVGSQRNTR